MITLNSRFLFALIVQGCIFSALIPFATFAQNKTKEDGKIHIIIKKEENGKEINIDTVFESNDEKAAEEFIQMQDTATAIKSDNGRYIFMFKADPSSEKLSKQLEKMEEKMKTMNFEFNMDSMNKNGFGFEMNIPDQMEMEQLESKLNELQIEMPELPMLPDLPQLPDINMGGNGLNETDKKKFEEHIQKAKEEIRKALELMSDSTNNYKMNFYDDDSKGNEKLRTFELLNADTSIAEARNEIVRICTNANVSPEDNKCIIIYKIDQSNSKEKNRQKVDNADVVSAKTNSNSEKVSPSETNSFSDLKCYPNPSSDVINIAFTAPSTEMLNLSIVNGAGKEVVSETYENFSGRFNKQYDLSKFGKGIYLLKITQGKIWEHQKIIVK